MSRKIGQLIVCLMILAFVAPAFAYTTDQASNGKELYVKYCAVCHGAGGEGGDEALPRFDRRGDFASIVSSKREVWNKWVKEKIDAGDFDNRVLKYDRDGEKEIDLSEMTAHLSMG